MSSAESSETSDSPKLAALKDAWASATERDREHFSKWLLAATSAAFTEAMNNLKSGVDEKLWLQT